MNDKIKEEEVKVLEAASREYPTWGCFKDIIDEAKNKDFPSSNFDCQPIQCPNHPLVPVTVLNSDIVRGDFAGIDVPVLLKPTTNANGKTIVIVGESPLRDTNNSKNQNKVLLGTPYAVHQKFDAPSQCNVYKKIFSDLLNEGYSVYLTDIIKVWWEGKDLKAYADDKKIFEKEIQKILNNGKIGKDLFIVAWGNKAGGVLEKDYPFLIKLLHPSQQNWNNWKLHIFEKAIYDKKDITYATSQYPQKDSKTNEVIVASEAIKEILENVLENVKKIEKDFKKYLNIIDEEKLVECIADDFNDLGIPRDDLLNAGEKGLKMASKKTFGKTNNAYAAWWIRQKMLQILKK